VSIAAAPLLDRIAPLARPLVWLLSRSTTLVVRLLGGEEAAIGLRYAAAPPTIVLLAGLQGSGKTTTSVKLALLARREGHRPALVALDLRRPAAVDQLRLLAERVRQPSRRWRVPAGQSPRAAGSPAAATRPLGHL